ncbi:MAG: hypothetical protein OCD02_13190 [Spirochaetaceae bacterium]
MKNTKTAPTLRVKLSSLFDVKFTKIYFTKEVISITLRFMKKTTLCVIIILIVSCQKTLDIETEPSGAKIYYNGIEFNSPAELEYSGNSNLLIKKEFYKDIKYTAEETKLLLTNKNNIKLTPKLYLLKITNRNELMDITINGEKAKYRIELPHGEHQIEIKREGYFTFKQTISIPDTNELNPQLIEIYILKEIPKGISDIKINNDKIYLNTEFYILNNTNRFEPGYIPTKISFKYNDLLIDTTLHNMYIKNRVLNLQLILDEFINEDKNKPKVIIESDWIKEFESPFHLKKLFSGPTGFENMPDVLIKGDNKIIQKPLNLFPHLSIANPTSAVIGAYFIAKSGDFEKKYEITSEFYNSNIDEMYAGEEYNPDGIYTKQKFLKIDNLDLDAPFNNAEIECYLYINNIVTDSVKLKVNKDVYNKFGDTSYGVYSDLRESIFYQSKNPSKIHYLYSDESRSGEFLIIYMSKNREYIPIYTYKIGDVSSTPAKILLEENDSNNYFILITKDLSNIENWYARQFKYFTDK